MFTRLLKYFYAGDDKSKKQDNIFQMLPNEMTCRIICSSCLPGNITVKEYIWSALKNIFMNYKKINCKGEVKMGQ